MSCSRTAFFLLLQSTKVAFLRGGGRIPVMGLWGGGAYPPLPYQYAVLSLEGDPVRVAIYTAVLTGSRILILADAWSEVIVCSVGVFFV